MSRKSSSVLAEVGDVALAAKHAENARLARDRRNAIADMIVAKGYTPVTHTPNLRAMAKSLGMIEKYLMYIVASQSPHGSIVGVEELFATRTPRGGVRLGDRASAEGWQSPFAMCWYALHSAGPRLLTRWGCDEEDYPGTTLGLRVQAAINRISGTA